MPKKRSARLLTDCLDADPSMARLTTHARRLLNLQRSLDAAAPAALARSCRVANFKLGVVFIHADNGAVAAKLRQITARLGDEFRKRGAEVTEIRVKVQPATGNNPTRLSVSSYTVSVAAKRGLTSLADRLPEESPLRQALKRLVGRSRTSNT